MSRIGYYFASIIGAGAVLVGIVLVLASFADQNMYLLVLGVLILGGSIWRLKGIEDRRPGRHRDVDA